jgi:hypothetical protein
MKKAFVSFLIIEGEEKKEKKYYIFSVNWILSIFCFLLLGM